MEPRRRRQRWFGQPRAADRPRQTTPIPPPLSVQLPLGQGHALPPPPPRAAFRSAARPRSGAGGKAVPGRGRRGSRELQGPTAFAAPPRPLSSTTQRASPGAQPMGAKPGKKGARVRMRLRKGMLPAPGQRSVRSARRAVCGRCAPACGPPASLKRQPYFFLRWQFRAMLERGFEGRAQGNE